MPSCIASHPTRVRGLKPAYAGTWKAVCPVAPHAGAWIETACSSIVAPRGLVAPHAGAWIETEQRKLLHFFLLPSHPTRVRGLKLHALQKIGRGRGSHPTRVRGLKRGRRHRVDLCEGVAPHAGAWIETTGPLSLTPSSVGSHPTRVRGLKLHVHGCGDQGPESHPTRVRD